MGLGPLEIGLIILAILLLFGYKKLPDASRSLGRSLRIFKGEMKGMKDDDVRTRAEAESVRPELDRDRSIPMETPVQTPVQKAYAPAPPVATPAPAPVPPAATTPPAPPRTDDPR